MLDGYPGIEKKTKWIQPFTTYGFSSHRFHVSDLVLPTSNDDWRIKMKMKTKEKGFTLIRVLTVCLFIIGLMILYDYSEYCNKKGCTETIE